MIKEEIIILNVLSGDFSILKAEIYNTYVKFSQS